MKVPCPHHSLESPLAAARVTSLRHGAPVTYVYIHQIKLFKECIVVPNIDVLIVQSFNYWDHSTTVKQCSQQFTKSVKHQSAKHSLRAVVTLHFLHLFYVSNRYPLLQSLQQEIFKITLTRKPKSTFLWNRDPGPKNSVPVPVPGLVPEPGIPVPLSTLVLEL